MCAFAGLVPMLVSSPCADGQQADITSQLASIEKEIEANRAKLHVPGIAVAIVKDDRVIWSHGFGLRDVEMSKPVTPDTLFAIGSCSKAFTAMSVLMSQEDGKLSLTDSPKKYLPYFKLKDQEADSKITLSDLLCHRSGLDRTDLAWYTNRRLSTADVIRIAGEAQQASKLGEKMHYQNVMFAVAGHIVETVQGTTWRGFLGKRIWDPLGMKATNATGREMARARDHAIGYAVDPESGRTTPLPFHDIQNVAPAGAINSSVKEMAQWVRLMLNGGIVDGNRLLSEKSFAELTVSHGRFSPGTDYGYGWFLQDWHGHKLVQHGGNIDGFSAMTAFMPDQRLGLVALTNAEATALPAVTMETVFKNLVPIPKEEAALGPAVKQAEIPGTYDLREANLRLLVERKDGSFTLLPSGQPKVPLELVAGSRFTAKPPAPAGVFLTFRYAKENPKEVELFFEQGAAKLIAKRIPDSPFNSPIKVDDLMNRMIQAAGGEANLRRHRSLRLRFTAEFLNQGVRAEGVDYYRTPNAYAETLDLMALGRRIGWIRECANGAAGWDESTNTISVPKRASEIKELAIVEAFEPELRWKELFATVTIRGMEKLDGEDAYVIEKKPAIGPTVTEYVSTTSFRVLKREIPGKSTHRFSDFRTIDGEAIPFSRDNTTPDGGNVAVRIREARFNVSMPDALFRPHKLYTRVAIPPVEYEDRREWFWND